MKFDKQKIIEKWEIHHNFQPEIDLNNYFIFKYHIILCIALKLPKVVCSFHLDNIYTINNRSCYHGTITEYFSFKH